MFKYIVWLFVKPKHITNSDIKIAEDEYEDSFIKWLNSSSSEDKAATKALDKAAKRMNDVKRKHKKWMKYAKWKGIKE